MPLLTTTMTKTATTTVTEDNGGDTHTTID
jgi:hypothetical protein